MSEGIQNITSVGTKILFMDVVHPQGFTVTQAPQDGTFIDIPNVGIGNVSPTLNGHGVYYATPSAITMAVSVIPNGEDDKRFSESVAFARTQGIGFNLCPFAIYKTDSLGNKDAYGTFYLTDVPVDNTYNTDGSIATKTYTLMGIQKIM